MIYTLFCLLGKKFYVVPKTLNKFMSVVFGTTHNLKDPTENQIKLKLFYCIGNTSGHWTLSAKGRNIVLNYNMKMFNTHNKLPAFQSENHK